MASVTCEEEVKNIGREDRVSDELLRHRGAGSKDLQTHLDLETLLRRKLSRTPSSLEDGPESSTVGRHRVMERKSARNRRGSKTRREPKLTRKEELGRR